MRRLNLELHEKSDKLQGFDDENEKLREELKLYEQMGIVP